MQTIQVLVDHANLVYRAYYSSLRFVNVRPWMPIIRYFDMLRLASERIKRVYPNDKTIKFIFAGESYTTLKRSILDPSYKAHRTPSNDDELRKFRKIIVKILKANGWDLIRFNGSEADDIIASLASRSNSNLVSVVFSNDRDLRQLLQFDNVVIFQNPGMFYTKQMFEQEHGFTVDKYLHYKALLGDKSDNISGVKGWGPVKSKHHIIAGDWFKVLQPEELDAYNRSLALSALDYSLVFPMPERSPFETRADYKELLIDFYTKESLQEVELALNRFEAALTFFSKKRKD